MLEITIPGRPITKKNHSQIRRNARTGKPFLSPSDQYKAYAAAAGWYIPARARLGLTGRYNVKCLYFMPTRHKVDLCNLLEATCDILKDCGVVADDESKIIAAHDGSRVLYDKDNPRAEIYISELEE